MGIGPFSALTLFEGSLLALVATRFVIFIIVRLMLSSPPGVEADDYDEMYEWEDEDEIPEHKFFRTESGKTWEAWVKYTFANAIYDDLAEAPYSISRMGDRQLQELSIRLAETGVAVVRGKSSRTQKLQITIAAMRRQMAKTNQRPYDDEILKIAIRAVNNNLKYAETEHVVRQKLWDEPYSLFD